ncbi:MAG: DNA starvation/stationary phase protection protein [Ignavibacteria bacterium]|nr:DNA starvation/stationary phase protection protein [Ignavibacteria bacterium]
MAKTNAIGIDARKATNVAAELNELLANYEVFYQNLRGFHWNIRGEKFFELHAKFEELYLNIQVKIDEVAERILTLGATPAHTFASFQEISSVKPAENIKEGKRAVQRILSGFTSILLLQRELLELTNESGDIGTNTMMANYITEQEKIVWMYTAYIG